METTKRRGSAAPKRKPTQPEASPPAPPRGGTHPETVKPDDPGKLPTKHADQSHVDGRTKDDKDANEQQ